MKKTFLLIFLAVVVFVSSLGIGYAVLGGVNANLTERATFTGLGSFRKSIPAPYANNSTVTVNGITYKFSTATNSYGVTEIPKQETVTIPATVNGYPVTTVHSTTTGTLSLNYATKVVNLGENVTILEANSFDKLSNLNTVNGMERVQYIGASAFKSRFSLREITLRDIQYIGASAFEGDFGLKLNWQVPDENLITLSIGASAFKSAGSSSTVNIRLYAGTYDNTSSTGSFVSSKIVVTIIT
ncbi:leucine-rich repeat protein [Acholeplasma hippikon]|uniref:Uncharacterized protein n=1 Tax=Acholeplasma hippikon TaxID=264636 RepID=A0A449BLC7_9MOLU|nr:leucine-rich repeat protein [Acholeplasma hippikon]VEU83240.1 Uncharacterised protein [Acholeplasma hippikon]